MAKFVFIGYGREAVLVGPGGLTFEPFLNYRDILAQKNIVSESTLHDYLGHVHRFIEFVHAAAQLEIPNTKQSLSHVISSYESYLMYAEDSIDPIAQKIAKLTGRKNKCSPSSLPAIESALIHFLRISDNKAKEVGKDGLFSEYMPGMYQKMNHHEVAKLREGSMLGGLLTTGVKYKRKAQGNLFSTTRRLKRSAKKPYKHESFIFPLERLPDLIEATSTYRDRAIYSLLASSGMRVSEVLQITFRDIDFEKRALKCVNPFGRKYIGITEYERSKLKYKGRVRPNGDPEDVFLIPPYDDLFFEYLSLYLEREYIKGQSHTFIFQVLTGKEKGRPYFVSDRSTRIKNFNKRVKSIGFELPQGVSIHSLRHGAASYLLNEVETPSGKGLPLIIISYLLAHKDIKTTEIYVTRNKNDVLDTLDKVRKIFYGKGNSYDMLSSLEKYLRSQK